MHLLRGIRKRWVLGERHNLWHCSAVRTHLLVCLQVILRSKVVIVGTLLCGPGMLPLCCSFADGSDNAAWIR